MSAAHRLPHGGRIDRSRPLRFGFDGLSYEGCAGDTLASALLANGVDVVGRSVVYGRPRGIYAAGVEEPNALVELAAGDCSEPMLRATGIELYDGLEASSLSGRGRLSPEPDPAVYDKLFAHCHVLVVGGGPAGLAAALAAARTGARVVLADEQPELGGSLLGNRDHIDGAPAAEWVAEAAAELAVLPEARTLPRTTAVGYFDHNEVLLAERRTDHLGPDVPPEVPRQRLWHVRARRVVLATGAHERPLVFADNDRPGIMLASAARTYVNRYGVAAGRTAVVVMTNDSAYAAVLDLADAGVAVAAVVDARPAAGGPCAERVRARGMEVLEGHCVVGTSGDRRIEAADVMELGTGGDTRVEAADVALLSDGEPGERRSFACDLLCVSGGWNPAVHLFSQSRGTLRYDERLACYVPDQAVQAQHSVGACRGTFTLGGCLSEGLAAGAEAATLAGFGDGRPPATPTVRELPERPPRALWVVPPAASPEERTAPGGSDWSTHFVDLQRDATVADVRRAAGAGMRSPEHIKRFTTIGTGADQGKTAGPVTLGVLAETLRTTVSALDPTTFRPPYTPLPYGLLAGRERGRLHDPARVTPIHSWHVEHGAVFEDVGQWKRPWYYPLPGEDMETAVLRECRAARDGVALMDASTLGKIDVQGPDAAAFLNRIYTNAMDALAVGACKYGVMCTADGMVFDDGVAMRLAPERYLITTTTGNAAAVLDWLEEWLQTEWPELHAYCTSVTEQWATVAVVGPRSREVLASLAPGMALDAGRFPFMRFREGLVAGLEARVCRISFSGELAYEINVAGHQGLALWEAVVAAGEDRGITPYGTETMHVLRAEKGYPIVGQDTDGTVTPQDLGMDWIVSKKKGDFVGRRSHRRPDAMRPDRKRLAGLLPQDPQALLPEGAQLVLDPERPVPVPTVGHVTSSYRSATLGRTFALALIAGGAEHEGRTIYAPLADGTIAATVTESVLYDREGKRRDGDGKDPPLGGGQAAGTASARPGDAAPASAPPTRAATPGASPTGPATASAPPRRAALEELAIGMERASLTSAHDVVLRESPFPAQVNLRLDATDARLAGAVADAVGLTLPTEPNTVSGDARRAVLWLGPDEWLVVGPEGSEQELEHGLRETLAGAPGSVVDVSANRTALELAGPRAREVLMKGCSLDLHPRSFQAGSCAQTALARAQVVLWQLGAEPSYRILVRPSFAPYLAEWLMDAMAEYRAGQAWMSTVWSSVSVSMG